MKIFVDNRLFLAKTENKGFGIFTKDDIEKNTTIELSPALIINDKNFKGCLKKIKIWAYNWNKKNIGLSSGFGALYNHNYDPNVTMNYCFKKYFCFKTTKDIKKNEELFINYGRTWWDEPKYPETKIVYDENKIFEYLFINDSVELIKNHNGNHVLKAKENIKDKSIIEIARCLCFYKKEKHLNEKNTLNDYFYQNENNLIFGFGYSNMYKINKSNFNINCYKKGKKLYFAACKNINKNELLKINSKYIK